MYVPSDFFFSSFVWMDAFQLRRPFTLERPCSYHIMNKEVDPVVENDAVLEPPDADHSFTCKVCNLLYAWKYLVSTESMCMTGQIKSIYRSR